MYNDASPFADSVPPPDSSADLDDMSLIPVSRESILEPVDQSIPLHVDFAVFKDGRNHGAFNDKAWQIPDGIPTLYSARSLRADLKRDVQQYGNARAILLDHMNVIQLVIYNWDTGSHPFHLHGHVFQVVGRGPVTDSEPSVQARVNPVRRDTVQIPDVRLNLLIGEGRVCRCQVCSG